MMTSLSRRNALKRVGENSLAASSLINSAKWVTPIVLAQALPIHAQSSTISPLSVTPDITLGNFAGPSIIGINTQSSSGNTINDLYFSGTVLETLNMNLVDQFSSNSMPELNVSVSGEVSLTSINGPSETDFSGLAANVRVNVFTAPGFTNFNLVPSNYYVLLGMTFPIVVPSSPSAEPIEYLFEYRAQVTINSPDVVADIQEAYVSYVVTVTYQDALTSSPQLQSTFPFIPF